MTGGSVGVVIPAYNAERFLAPAIESVLRQTVYPAAIVVVDDGSTDGTEAVVRRFASRVACLRQPNAGVAAARNRGAARLGTEWIAFLDADDVWMPDKLARQLAAARDADVAAVLCGVALIDAQDRRLPPPPRVVTSLDVEALLLHSVKIPQATPSTILIRTALFNDIGGYDEALATMADWDLLIRLRLRTELAYVDEPLALYRRYPGTMSRNVAMLERESQIVLRKAFARPDLPPQCRRLRRASLAWNDLVLSGSLLHTGRPLRALRFGLRAVGRDPRLIVHGICFPFRLLRRRLKHGRSPS